MTTTINYENLIGQQYVFKDGDSITIIQIKNRDGNVPWVTYHIKQGPGIPRKQLMAINEFIETYGHLFGIITEDNSEPKQA